MTALYYGSLAFKAWMLVDALQRGCAYMWYFLIVAVPFGEWAYFIAVKSHDYRWRHTLFRFQRPPSIEKLRYTAEMSPSLENRALLAQALCERGEHQQALEIFEELVGRDPLFKRAVYGLARCHMQLGRFEQALEPLTRLVDMERGYSDYGAWVDLARCHQGLGDVDTALELLRSLVKARPRLEHVIELARALRTAGRAAEAQRLLGEALLDYRHSPRHVRRLFRAHARTAKKLLSELPRSGLETA